MTRVLVVDDEPEIRRVLEEICREAGYEVVSASDGIEALELIERGGVTLVLLDLSMPRLDGFGVLERMRSMPIKPRPGVIVITAHADAEGRVRGADLGALDFVTKPFRIPDMRRRMQRVFTILDLEHRLEGEEMSLSQIRGRDPVTGAGTFAMLYAALEAQFQYARVTGKELSCVVVSDERFNDRLRELGREKGDERLQSIAERIESLLRGADLLFRVDAAEFVLLLPGTPMSGARRVIDRVQEALLAGELGDIELAIAAATYPHPELTQASVLYRAVNVALAQARTRTSRRVIIFEGF